MQDACWVRRASVVEAGPNHRQACPDWMEQSTSSPKAPATEQSPAVHFDLDSRCALHAATSQAGWWKVVSLAGWYGVRTSGCRIVWSQILGLSLSLSLPLSSSGFSLCLERGDFSDREENEGESPPYPD